MPKIWSPSPVAILHPSLFMREEIEHYEREILSNAKANERDASQFFSKFPKFLLLGKGAEIRREVGLIHPDGKQIYRVDFFRRDFGNVFWDIIELKSPQTPFIVGANHGHPRLSAKVHDAIIQGENYRDLIEEDDKIRSNLLKQGIRIKRPQIVIVVGRENEEVAPETMRILCDRIQRGPFELFSYTKILQFAKEHYESNRIIILSGSFDITNEFVNKTDIKNEFVNKTFRIEPEAFIIAKKSGAPSWYGAAREEIFNGAIELIEKANKILVQSRDLNEISRIKEAINKADSLFFDLTVEENNPSQLRQILKEYRKLLK